MVVLDDIDRKILNRIQSDFPITPRPFLSIADEIGLTEYEVINRINKLKSNDIIRRIGGNFSPKELNFVSTLCAAKVPIDLVDFFAETVNQYAGVTHNYYRDCVYNIWFTFIAPSMDEIENNIQNISEKTGIKDILNLPANKVFKIKAHFNL